MFSLIREDLREYNYLLLSLLCLIQSYNKEQLKRDPVTLYFNYHSFLGCVPFFENNVY